MGLLNGGAVSLIKEKIPNNCSYHRGRLHYAYNRSLK
jgi:hypothetical protein